MSRRVRVLFVVVLVALAAGLVAERARVENASRSAGVPIRRTVAGVLALYGDRARMKFAPACRTWPPKSLTLLAFKRERILEVRADGARIAVYPILAASGVTGPKWRQNDLQVPEGFYRLPILNPNSILHLSIRIDYPNADDIARAIVPRNEMGGDIYLHGGESSVGCIAVGDEAIEELFCLAALVPDRQILIAPVDFRTGSVVKAEEASVQSLYVRLAAALDTMR